MRTALYCAVLFFGAIALQNLRMRTRYRDDDTEVSSSRVRNPTETSMRPIQWAKPVRRYSLVPFIQVPPDAVVILCAAPHQFATLNLHYLGRTSAPCFGGECVHCQRGVVPELYSYAPALFKCRIDGSYKKGVLPIGTPFGELGDSDLRGNQLTVSKTKRDDGTTSTLKVRSMIACDASLLKVIGVCWFDVRPRLLQRWGIDPAQAEPLPIFDQVPADQVPTDDDAPAILRFPGNKSA